MEKIKHKRLRNKCELKEKGVCNKYSCTICGKKYVDMYEYKKIVKQANMPEIKQKAREEFDKFVENLPAETGKFYYYKEKTWEFIDSILSQALAERDGDWRLAIMHLSTEQRESVLKILSSLKNK